MALFAAGAGVLEGQREACLAVVKFEFLKGGFFFKMAFVATTGLCRVRVLVHVLVA
jgi:hypothetical protein